MTTTRITLIQTIAEVTGISAAEISPDHTLTSLGADSLDAVEIAMNMENKLNLTTQLDVVFEATPEPTIAQIAAAIDGIVGAK